MKSVQIRSFFLSVFSRSRTEYGEIRSISTLSDRNGHGTSIFICMSCLFNFHLYVSFIFHTQVRKNYWFFLNSSQCSAQKSFKRTCSSFKTAAPLTLNIYWGISANITVSILLWILTPLVLEILPLILP